MPKDGRPKISLDWNEFDRLCAMQCTLQEIAEWFHCSTDTIERRVKEEKSMSFAEYFDKKRVAGKIALRRNMLRLSERSATMAKFLAQNWLDMKETYALTGAEGQPIKKDVKIEFTKDEISQALAILITAGAVRLGTDTKDAKVDELDSSQADT